MGLKGSKTEQSLRDAFAGEWQANRRYLYFANKAGIEGQNDVAALFRSLGRLIGVEDRIFVEVDGHARSYAIADEDLERETEEKTSA